MSEHFDYRGAEIFGKMFLYLSDQSKTTETDVFARKAWEWIRKCNFTPSQMDVVGALSDLGLARVVSRPDGSQMVLYDGDEGFEDALAAGAPSEDS